jgi:2-polyprenyl-3-methyl-5-hydroxy-6-metoxy-1,4-benzoquinol methylase
MSSHQSAEADADLRRRREQGYETARPDVLALVPTTVQRILELGCSTGALGSALKARNGAFILGVEIDPEYAREAEGRLDRVVVADAEAFLAAGEPHEAPFDCLIGADVFEHLADPWSALARATGLLEPGAAVVISLPNVLYLPGLWRVIVGGRWPRDDAGVFDRTHLRWFTMRDAVELLEGAGLHVQRVSPNYPARGWRHGALKLLGHTPLRRFLAVQWVVLGEKTRSRSVPARDAHGRR